MRPIVGIVLSAWSLLAIMGVAAASGVRVNTTPSMPIGLWLEHVGPVHVGEAAVVCLPFSGQTKRYVPAGTCDSGLRPLLKTVAAAEGDTVSVTPDGIAVNGQNIPNTAALSVDHAGRTLRAYPPGTYTVPHGEVWLISNRVLDSYDSRYYGPVSTRHVIAVGRPLWIFY